MGFLQTLFGDPLAKARDALRPDTPRGKNFDPAISAIADDGAGYGPPASQTWSMRHLGTPSLSYPSLAWYARQPILGLPPKVQRFGVIDFCQPVESPLKQGFRIRLMDEGQQMTKADRIEARRLSEIIYRAGGRFQWPPTPGDTGGMAAAMSMFIRDSLVYDQAVFEVLRERSGGVYGWLVQDATMFRLARPSAEAYRTRQVFPDREDVTYVEIDDYGTPVQTFTRDELCWFIRAPRSQLRWRGYGFPEYDEFNGACETLLGAYTYNAANFKNGVHAYNIVTIKGGMSPDQFEKWRLNILTMLTQARNAHRTMVTNLEKDGNVDIKQIGSTNAEMEFADWMHINIRLLCACYGMDSAEINQLYGNEGQKSALTSSGPEDRVKVSRQRWLRPLLRQLAEAFTVSVIHQENPDFAMEFCGLGLPSEETRLKMDIDAVRSFKTINEVRREHDLPDLDYEVCDILPLDPTIIGAWLQQSRQGDTATYDDGEDYPTPGEGYDPAPDDATAFDEAMKGTDWNSVAEWTERLARVATEQKRVRRIGPGRIEVDVARR